MLLGEATAAGAQCSRVLGCIRPLAPANGQTPRGSASQGAAAGPGACIPEGTSATPAGFRLLHATLWRGLRYGDRPVGWSPGATPSSLIPEAGQDGHVPARNPRGLTCLATFECLHSSVHVRVSTFQWPDCVRPAPTSLGLMQRWGPGSVHPLGGGAARLDVCWPNPAALPGTLGGGGCSGIPPDLR